jgi:hypothetical protein
LAQALECRGRLPQEVQHTIFEAAVVACLALFLHDRHPRTSTRE